MSTDFPYYRDKPAGVWAFRAGDPLTVSHRGAPRVVIVGGSLGGLNTLLWLLDAGCSAEVFERTPTSLTDRGTGIVLHPATVRYVQHRGGSDLEGMTAVARWFRYLNPDGSEAHVEASHYRFTSYSSLVQGLLQRTPPGHYHRGEECIGFEQVAEEVVVRFASGRLERCDLLVFADGISSTGRRLLLPDVTPRYAGYIAWRGAVPEEVVEAEGFGALGDAITYTVLPDSHALSYPIPTPQGRGRQGQRSINWLWYRNVAPGEDLERTLTGRDGTRFNVSLPPGHVPSMRIQTLRDEAQSLPPSFQQMICLTEEPFIQAVFDLEVPRMAFRRVCLLGDASFAARPHTAAGTAKAAENAWRLGKALKGAGMDIDAALQQWEPEQLALGQQLIARARDAGERLQSGRWHAGEPLSFGLYQQGDSVFPE